MLKNKFRHLSPLSGFWLGLQSISESSARLVTVGAQLHTPYACLYQDVTGNSVSTGSQVFFTAAPLRAAWKSQLLGLLIPGAAEAGLGRSRSKREESRHHSKTLFLPCKTRSQGKHFENIFFKMLQQELD